MGASKTGGKQEAHPGLGGLAGHGRVWGSVAAAAVARQASGDLSCWPGAVETGKGVKST